MAFQYLRKLLDCRYSFVIDFRAWRHPLIQTNKPLQFQADPG